MTDWVADMKAEILPGISGQATVLLLVSCAIRYIRPEGMRRLLSYRITLISRRPNVSFLNVPYEAYVCTERMEDYVWRDVSS